jgi:hypothetical protein
MSIVLTIYFLKELCLVPLLAALAKKDTLPRYTNQVKAKTQIFKVFFLGPVPPSAIGQTTLPTRRLES